MYSGAPAAFGFMACLPFSRPVGRGFLEAFKMPVRARHSRFLCFGFISALFRVAERKVDCGFALGDFFCLSIRKRKSPK